jgi:hypothetical protein
MSENIGRGAALDRPARRQVEDHPLAQGAARRLQLVDAEVHRQRVEQRQAAGDDGAPVVPEARQVEPVGAAGLEAAPHQPAQASGVTVPSPWPLAASTWETAPTVPEEPSASRQWRGANGPIASFQLGAGGDLRFAEGRAR